MVHRREIDGREIVLGNHGALWGNAMTWYDHETGSIWSQPLGEAILGPLTGTKLDLLPSTLTRWQDWTEAHPDSFALDAPSSRDGVDLQAVAVVVELNGESLAFPISRVRTGGVANADVGGVPVAVTSSEVDNNWAVFSRRLDGRIVELAVVDQVLVEVDGDGRWDRVTGFGLGATPENLDLLPGFTSFPADYRTFYPDGAIWPE